MEAPRTFVGRREELDALRTFTREASRGRLTAIYGRRRVGKTRLVKEAYAGAAGLPLFHFEGLEGAGSSEQKSHFLRTLHRYSRSHAHRLASASDWEDLLILLVDHLGPRPCVVFFDEFQWMAAGRNDLVAKLKYIWDNFLADRPIHLILCGSISSFLVKKVIHSRALHGRIDAIIDLRPLPLPQARDGFFGERSLREALEYYMVMGGIPTYLELYDPARSVRLNLQTLCFGPRSYFLDEVDRLFVSHFGGSRHYRKIVEYLSRQSFATREMIARQIDLKVGGRLSSILADLELAGFVEGYGPLHNPESTHLRRYRIIDPYLRFYFRFIQPIRRQIKAASREIPLHRALPDKKYEPFCGLAFEHLCRQHAHLIAERLGFSGVAYEQGSWFRRGQQVTGVQVDLLFRRADRVMTLCEVKFRDHVGKGVIKEVEQKVRALEPRGGYAVEKVLITLAQPTRELVDEGYFSSILTAAALFG